MIWEPLPAAPAPGTPPAPSPRVPTEVCGALGSSKTPKFVAKNQAAVRLSGLGTSGGLINELMKGFEGCRCRR